MTVRERITDQPPVQLKAMRERVQALYMQGGDSSRTNRVLSEAFDELALALEQLHAAEQALQRQQSEALNRQAELELDNRRYQDLFEYAPTGYLVTSIDGAIRQANRVALALLQAPERAIAGRALGLFIPEGQRRAFRNSIAQLLETDQPQEWFVTMQSWQGAPFEARLTASVLRGASGKPIAIYWLVHNAG